MEYYATVKQYTSKYSMLAISRGRVAKRKNTLSLSFTLVTVDASKEENGVLGAREQKEANFSLYTLLHCLNFASCSLV